MIDNLGLMLWPLMACFILVGIHAYLGIHVIARKVIFVDLALAQIAGLGAVYGIFLGLSFETDTLALKVVSVIFTLLGACLFSLTRTENEHIPHEAIIGIIYAAALSLTVVMTANLPHGADEVQQMLAGNILWVTPKEVLSTGALYSILGLIHWFCRKPFFALSYELSQRTTLTLTMRWWDFLFYATFGVVVTSSVGIGGVLLVFGFLVIPSVIGVMLAESAKHRLLIGWAVGVIASIIGVVVSFYLDLPSGPTIVVLLACTLILVAIYQELLDSARRMHGIIHILLFAVATAAFLLIPKFVDFDNEDHAAEKHAFQHGDTSGKNHGDIIRSMLNSSDSSQLIEALQEIESKSMVELLPDTLPLLSYSDATVREKAIRLQGILEHHQAIPSLLALFPKESDDFIKISIAEALLHLGESRGFSLLLSLSEHHVDFVRSDALSHMRKWLLDAPEDDQQMILKVRQQENTIHFNPARKKYAFERE